MNTKTALVTGAGRGIGRAIALVLGERGWNLVINYRNDESAAQQTARLVEAGGGCSLVIQADISQAADRQNLLAAALATFGQIDLLVNNAGMAPRQRVDVLDLTEASYNEVMSVNLTGPFFLAQQAARVMLQQVAEGKVVSPMIINIGSISAYASSLNRAEYCISKAGLAMVTALLADRLAEAGIGVYEIRPGIIATDMTAGVKERYDGLIAAGLTPIRRWGQPADVARAVLALAEGALPFSTGEVINVDGGFHLRRF